VRAADVITARDPHTVDEVVQGLVDEAHDHAERVAVAEQERDRLAQLDLPRLSLPHIPTGIDLGALYELADRLRAGGLGSQPRP
jgi:hypothetical protein